MAPCAFIYSPRYYCDIGPHVFPTDKFRRVYEALQADGDIPPERFVEPEEIAVAAMRLVHTEAYLGDFLNGVRSERTRASELPLTEEIVRANRLGTGGTLLACRRALAEGLAMNLGGGFHHAFPDHAEGFCYLNDIAIALRVLQGEGRLERAAIVDLDLHQGNGNAFIFQTDARVFTFSMHQDELYPVKQLSKLDLGLPKGTGDGEYLELLEAHLPGLLDTFRPHLVVYQAGVDPLEGDQLGDLRLSRAGLRRRDACVVDHCRRRGIPLAGVLGGGYARDTEETVRAHHATCRVMWEAAGSISAR